MWLDVLDTLSGRFIKLDGENLLRTDQSVRFQIGDLRRGWKFIINRDEIPHRYSNSAMTPFIYRGSGLFTLPGQVSIIKDGDDATGTPSLVPTAPQMTVNDSLIADYLKTFLRPEELAIQRNRTDIALNFSPSNQVAFHLNYSDERRDGSKLGYGPIGDRPPRTLNVQVQEPVDHITREIHANFEYSGKRFQSALRYVLSFFENNINAMQWENIYLEPDAGSDFIASVAGTPRNVSSFGQRSLAPDNFAYNVVFSGGLNLPRGSRADLHGCVRLPAAERPAAAVQLQRARRRFNRGRPELERYRQTAARHCRCRDADLAPQPRIQHQSRCPAQPARLFQPRQARQ